MGKIILGIEKLRCPQCGTINLVDIHSDMPDQDNLICGSCGYKALLNCKPLLDKYGLPHGLSTGEKRQITKHLKNNISQMTDDRRQI